MAPKRPRKPSEENPWPATLTGWQKKLGLTNDEMARRIGVPSRTWIAWKYGQNKPARTAQILIDLLMKQDGAKR